MTLFRILFVFDLLGVLGLAYFFVDGLQYSPGVDYMGAWFPILLAGIGGLILGWVLHAKGKRTAANILLGILALPFLFMVLFAGMFIVIAPDFK